MSIKCVNHASIATRKLAWVRAWRCSSEELRGRSPVETGPTLVVGFEVDPRPAKASRCSRGTISVVAALRSAGARFVQVTRRCGLPLVGLDGRQDDVPRVLR